MGAWAPSPWLFALALAFVHALAFGHAAIWLWAFVHIARARVAAGMGAPDQV